VALEMDGTNMTSSADPGSSERNGIPVIDLTGYFAGDGPASEMATKALRSALEEVGFFVITGHGVDWSLVDTAYAEAERFFDLSETEKQAVAIPGSFSDKYGKRGYMGFTSDAYGSTRGTNRIESFYFGHEQAGQNNWPADLGSFRDAMLSYLQAVDDLAYRLLSLYARALELDRDYFASYFDAPAVSFRAAHYPPTTEPGTWGLMPHTDRAFMTLLPNNAVAGLQIRPEGSDWLEAPVVEKAFIINSGDTLRRWTNDRFLSTPHRVVPPIGHRYSLPYFYSPSIDKTMSVLPTCFSGERPARYAPVTFDDFNREYFDPAYRPNDARLAG